VISDEDAFAASLARAGTISESGGGMVVNLLDMPPPAPAPAGPGVSLSTLVANLDKPEAISTLTKSSLDWDTYKHAEGLDDELAGAAAGGFVEKQAFLGRVEARRDEMERERRAAERSQRAAAAGGGGGGGGGGGSW
jgi:hypothetical protein